MGYNLICCPFPCLQLFILHVLTLSSIVQKIRVWSSKAELVVDEDDSLANQFFLGGPGGSSGRGCQFPHPSIAGGIIFIPFDDCLTGVPALIRRRVELMAY